MTVASEVAKWVVVALITVGALRMIGNIGKPGRSISPSDAATVVALDAVLIVAIVVFWRYGS